MNANWSDAKDIAAIIGALFAAFTFAKAILEYIKQGQQRRAELFLRMARTFFDNDEFAQIRGFLEFDDPKLAEIPLHSRRAFAAFLEEVSLLTNSRLIAKKISLYFFGYFAIDCWNSKHFWFGLERNTAYWSVLADYVRDMQKVANAHELCFSRRHFQF